MKLQLLWLIQETRQLIQLFQQQEVEKNCLGLFLFFGITGSNTTKNFLGFGIKCLSQFQDHQQEVEQRLFDGPNEEFPWF